jgi:hypothetical protein
VCTIGALRKAARLASKRARKTVLSHVPSGTLMGTMTASGSGSVWAMHYNAAGEASEMLPLDATQLAHGIGSEELAAPLHTMSQKKGRSESKLRGWCGGTTHYSSLSTAMSRADQRMGGALSQAAEVTVGLDGAGLGVTGLQAIKWLHGKGRIVWAAECDAQTSEAGRDLMQSCGQQPRMHKRAEEAGLRGAKNHTDTELSTLDCSPYSNANMRFPAGVEAALQELEAVISGAKTRRPKVLVCETTSGLWRHKELTRRYEYILSKSGLWDWEAILTSPHVHGGRRVRRWRVYYVGVLHEAVR